MPVAEPDAEGSGDGAPGRRAKIFSWPFPPPAMLPQSPRVRGWLLGLLFATAYLALRTLPAMLLGYESDVEAYTRWYSRIATAGLRNVYLRSDFDYPPLYAYLLWVIVKAEQLVGRVTGLAWTPSFPILLRFWPLTFDLAIGWMLWRLGRAAEGEGGTWRRILPLLYLLNPAVLIDTGYWGQTDSIHSAFVLAAFLALGWRACGLQARMDRDLPAWTGWVLLSLGAMMKPVAVPYFPLFLVLSVAWHRLRATFMGVGAALATVLIVCFPFAQPNPQRFVSELVTDLSSMPFTSCNAHNIWWIFGAWRPADEPWLGLLTATDAGHIFVGAFLLVLLVRAWKVAREREVSLAEGLGLAAALGMGFFMLSTHMHENHLFTVLPLLLPIAVLPWTGGPVRTRATLWLSAGVTAGLTLNMLAHDPWLMVRGPGAEDRIEAVLTLPTGARRELFAALGTALNLVTWLGLVRFLWAGPPGPRRQPEPRSRQPEPANR